MKRKKIGILGGGQLARMSSYQATRMGFEVSILEKKGNSPAGQISHEEFTGWVDDDKLKEFVNGCDIITLENEFIDYHALEMIESFGVKVLPSSRTISLIQDKLIQKQTLSAAGLPVPNFVEIVDNSSYNSLSELLGEQFIIKSRTMGYDGYGNALVRDEASFQEGIKKLEGRNSNLMAEEFVPFVKELAIMIARTEKEIVCYPIVETIQENHICHTVIAPAAIETKLREEIKGICINSVKAVEGIGIFGIELFLKEDNSIMINEMAPRPHNSGHYTIEACVTSQFENHIRAVLGMPLGSPEMIKPAAVMVNLLGKREGEGIPFNYENILNYSDVKFHIYGKEFSRVGRKMGHITKIGDDTRKLIKELEAIEKQIDI